MNLKDIHLLAELDTIYNQMRFIQAQHNATTTTPCKQSGKCCRIGLQIPMLECMNIAFQLNRNYFMLMELHGQQKADTWLRSIKDRLKARLLDKKWDGSGEQDMWCAFFEGGCTIYEYRPLVCRAYGTIVTVDDQCPRDRLKDGSVEIVGGENVKNMIENFKRLLDEFGEDHPQWDYVVYMPTGVLQFLLPVNEMKQLALSTDEKFWKGIPGYDTYFMNKILGAENQKNLSNTLHLPPQSGTLKPHKNRSKNRRK